MTLQGLGKHYGTNTVQMHCTVEDRLINYDQTRPQESKFAEHCKTEDSLTGRVCKCASLQIAVLRRA